MLLRAIKQLTAAGLAKDSAIISAKPALIKRILTPIIFF
jgi:hypothetical protein